MFKASQPMGKRGTEVDADMVKESANNRKTEKGIWRH
jgi:hypothetical protein